MNDQPKPFVRLTCRRNPEWHVKGEFAGNWLQVVDLDGHLVALVPSGYFKFRDGSPAPSYPFALLIAAAPRLWGGCMDAYLEIPPDGWRDNVKLALEFMKQPEMKSVYGPLPGDVMPVPGEVDPITGEPR